MGLSRNQKDSHMQTKKRPYVVFVVFVSYSVLISIGCERRKLKMTNVSTRRDPICFRS